MMKFAFSFKTSKNQSTVSSPQSAINNLQSAVNKEENNYQTIITQWQPDLTCIG